MFFAVERKDRNLGSQVITWLNPSYLWFLISLTSHFFKDSRWTAGKNCRAGKSLHGERTSWKCAHWCVSSKIKAEVKPRPMPKISHMLEDVKDGNFWSRQNMRCVFFGDPEGESSHGNKCDVKAPNEGFYMYLHLIAVQANVKCPMRFLVVYLRLSRVHSEAEAECRWTWN